MDSGSFKFIDPEGDENKGFFDKKDLKYKFY